MPITIGYQPAASAIAGPALIGGQGQYAQWANQYLNNQYQFGANLQFQQQNAIMDRLTALNQMANQNQMQQQQQAFQMQMAPLQSQLDMQQQAFQSDLGNQSHQQQQVLGAQLGSAQSQQDFAEQQQIASQQADQQRQLQEAHIQQQQAGQLANQQAMAQFNEDQQAAQQFRSDPLSTYKQNFQQAAQGDMSRYSDDQQRQMEQARTNLTGIQASISSGQTTLPSALAAIKSNMATLNQISANPANPPAMTPVERVQKAFVWQDPKHPHIMKQGGDPSIGEDWIPWDTDEKGKTDVPRNYVALKKLQSSGEAKGDDPELKSVKIRTATAKANSAEFQANSQVQEYVNENMHRWEAANPNYAPPGTPQFQQYAALRDAEHQRLLQEAENIKNAGPHQPTGQQLPTGPGLPPTQPRPPQITGANPGGAPAVPMPEPQQAPGAPAVPMPEPQQSPGTPQGVAMPSPASQLMPQAEAVNVAKRLKSTPREKWSPHDWVLWANALSVLNPKA